MLGDCLIIVAHDSDVCANAYPAFLERFVVSNCHKVVRAENRIWMQRRIIPVGVFTLWYLSTYGLISAQAHMVGFAIALVMQGSLMLWGFKVLKPKIAAAQGK